MSVRAAPGFDIRPARSSADVEAVRTLFREYETWLDEPVCFEGFEEELAGLPGVYAPPDGELWLGFVGRDAVGVVGMRPMNGKEPACEIKRLYVRDSWRGRGFGRKLVECALDWAAAANYRRVGLETVEKLSRARALYCAFGFVDVSDPGDKPLKSPIYMERRLV